MHRTGHIGVNLIVLSILGYFLVPMGLLLFGYGAAILIIVEEYPDRDFALPFVEHRGFTHTIGSVLLASVTVGTIGYWLGQVDIGYWLMEFNVPVIFETVGLPYAEPVVPTTELIVYGAAFGGLGVISHVIGDLFTPMGVPFLWPLSSRRFSLNWWKAKSSSANSALFSIGWLSVAVVGYLLIL